VQAAITTRKEYLFTNGLFAGSDIEQVYPSLKAISHPLRLKILCLISNDRCEDISVKELVHILGTSQSNISQHLRILKDNGVITSKKVDQFSFYRIVCPAVLQIIGGTRASNIDEPFVTQ